jgi:TRAP-type C4-dicarboxylate transport system substrate-binding protein
MDTTRHDQTLSQLRAQIASLPAETRAALEALADETAARQREIAASHAETLAVVRDFDQATARFHDATARMAGSSAHVLDKIQDALIDLNFVALDLESRNRGRNGSR